MSVPSATIRPATRLYVEDGLAEGRTLGLARDQAHFLRSVLRLGPGAKLAVFNARDGEWLAEIEGLGKGWCSLAVGAQVRRPGPEPDLWLVFAPIKRARIDFIAEKATELGCSLLQPVMTRFTAVSRVNEERLAANAREAAEQCERLTIPQVRPTRSLGEVLDDWPAERRLIVCAEWGAARPIAEALQAVRAEDQDEAQKTAGPWAILTGPEGGFAESELDALRKLPFVIPVGLGPRILRADTAALAALACWQAVLGDGAERPPADLAGFPAG
ncbi:16S rRNA (uracil(1498)-N(3))-methyltransferase [Pelagibius litoralis]|uniref:Ribosomal RNA small subunit methyltransferase E n=1 Tax=Pelagibius litoralis TaxID=374515 RepID=A0A967F152_9PROT|nr:16S rRNA (uracil(1498)-N(3))-methyltransferase [Pelagibius litoralis]NIA71216.1 16S rRNA (uracil(1498)-N(3))-methyltransferase [Pelagibius litoralis]